MKILHVISGLAKAAGTSAFCGELANALVARGHEVVIAVKGVLGGNSYTLDEHIQVYGVDNVRRDLIARRVSFDIIHVHGLWTPDLHRVSSCARTIGIPIVWSTHGMTSPWSMHHKWWKKWIAWHVYQRNDLACAALIHVTSEQEAGWNHDLGMRNRQVIVPLGTALAPIMPSQERAENKLLRVLFVGRIYPVKGLMNVVRAAARLKNAPISFRIVGPDQGGHLSELMMEAERLGVAGMFDWAGPKYGDDLSAEYDLCDIFILPSFTENFGAAVVDALAHGKPALTSRFTPWKILEDCRCGWWVSNTPESLADTFKKLLCLDMKELQEMGALGRKLVEARYTWGAVTDLMIESYLSIVKPVNLKECYGHI